MNKNNLLHFLLYGLIAYSSNSNAIIDMWIPYNDVRVVNGKHVIIRDEQDEVLGYVLPEPFPTQPGYEYHLFVDIDLNSERTQYLDGRPYSTINSRIVAVLTSRKITEEGPLQLAPTPALPADVSSLFYLTEDVDEMRALLVAGGYRLTKYSYEEQTQMRLRVLKAMLPVEVPELNEQMNAPGFEAAFTEWAAVSERLWAQPGPDRLDKIINVTANRLTALSVTDKCALALITKRSDRQAHTSEKSLLDRFHRSIDALRTLLPRTSSILPP